jgi:hypothetical protein
MLLTPLETNSSLSYSDFQRILWLYLSLQNLHYDVNDTSNPKLGCISIIRPCYDPVGIDSHCLLNQMSSNTILDATLCIHDCAHRWIIDALNHNRISASTNSIGILVVLKLSTRLCNAWFTEAQCTVTRCSLISCHCSLSTSYTALITIVVISFVALF